LHARKDGKGFDSGVIVGDPVNHGMAVAAEIVGRHVEGVFFGQSFSP
jgi:hypothetical protein